MKNIILIHSSMYLLCKVGWTDPHKIKTVMHPKPVISISLDTFN